MLHTRPRNSSSFDMAAHAICVGLLLFAAYATTGCDNAPDSATVEAVGPEAIPKIPVLPRVKWLDQRDKIPPEVWLASREAKADLGENDAAVVTLKSDLDAAARRFHDQTRMIANRAVQLETMLAGEGIEEHAPALIKSFTATAGSRQAREGFGAMCQHYFYLRKQGLGREAALAQLKDTSALMMRPRVRQARGDRRAERVAEILVR